MTTNPRNPDAGPQGRYYVEHVPEIGEDPREQLQALLDEKAAREWHLIGVAGGLPNGGVVFFWDTERPSFGRSDR